MKRLTVIIPIILLLTSCITNPAPVQKEFCATVKSEYNGVNIKADVKSENHTLTIGFKAPKNLKGYIYKYSGSDLSVEYGDIILNSEYDYLPQKAFTNVLYNVLKEIERDKTNCSGEYGAKARRSGKSASGEFAVEYDYYTGYISKIELKEINFSAYFVYK